MKQLFSVLLFLLLTINSFAQFSDTAQLNQFIRDTITDRRPDKITAAQLQKGLLGIAKFIPLTTPLNSMQVGYGNSNNILTGKSTFTFNDTTNMLNVQSLQVYGSSYFDGPQVITGTIAAVNNGFHTFFNPTINGPVEDGDYFYGSRIQPVMNINGNYQEAFAVDISPTYNLNGYIQYADAVSAALHVSSTLGGIRIDQISSYGGSNTGQPLFIYQGGTSDKEAILNYRNGNPTGASFIWDIDNRPSTTDAIIVPALRSTIYNPQAGGGVAFTLDRYYYGTEASIDMHYETTPDSTANDNTSITFNTTSNGNGVTPMYINGSNIGIGTNTPAAQLHTTGSVRFAGISSDNSQSHVLVSDADGNLFYRDASSLITTPVPTPPAGSNYEVQFNNGGVFGSNPNFVFSTYNNYVGIGTASPIAQLHVIGASPADVTAANAPSADVGFQAVGGAGGNTSFSTTVTGGRFSTANGGQGGNILLSSGVGGNPTSATTTAIGGAGGLIELAAGNGGSNSAVTTTTGQGGKGGGVSLFAGIGGTGRGTTAIGGAGGDVSIVSGRGGNTAGTSRTGGNSGNVSIQTDAGNNGATQGGSSGYIDILTGFAGSVNGSSGGVYIACGTATGTGAQGNIILGISHGGVTGGNVAIGTTSFVGSEKLRVNGDASINGVTTANYFNMSTTLTPSSSADTQGTDGDLRYDNDYIYIKIGGSWKRAALSTF